MTALAASLGSHVCACGRYCRAQGRLVAIATLAFPIEHAIWEGTALHRINEAVLSFVRSLGLG